MNSTAFHGTEKRVHAVAGRSWGGRWANPREAAQNESGGKSAVMTNNHGSMKPR